MSDYFDEGIPFGYHITFRAYGTWLHGDSRGSVDRFHNRFGTPRLPRNEQMATVQPPTAQIPSRQTKLSSKGSNRVCHSRNLHDQKMDAVGDQRQNKPYSFGDFSL